MCLCVFVGGGSVCEGDVSPPTHNSPAPPRHVACLVVCREHTCAMAMNNGREGGGFNAGCAVFFFLIASVLGLGQQKKCCVVRTLTRA